MIDITERQAFVLDYICEHFRREGCVPTNRELCDALGFSGVMSAVYYLRTLAKKGHISLGGPCKSRQYKILRLSNGTPVVHALIPAPIDLVRRARKR